MKIFIILLFSLSVQLNALENHDYNEKKDIQITEGLHLKLDIDISPKLTFIGSFNLEDGDRRIDVYDNTIFSLDDFLLLHDEEYIYIVDFKKGKQIGKFPYCIIDQSIRIESDKNGNAMIIYEMVTDSLVGENYHIPQALYYELIYKNGLYLLDQ